MNHHKLVLVTGGNGYVAIHCILQLLQQGYAVRTTIRSEKREAEVTGMLKAAGVDDFSRLSFVTADLMQDAHWKEAMEGCSYVLHVASPIFLELPETEDEMIRPAVDGTLRVLKAAKEAGVKRVVMTSNFGAVGYSHKNRNTVITEESWTDPNEKGLSAYNKSKVLAEKAAWNFISQEGGQLEFTAINPMAIFGPSLGPALSTAHGLLQKVMDGSMKALPDIRMGIVDVRDLANLHIRAMTAPAAGGQRFLALSGGTMSLLEIAALLKREMPQAAAKVSMRSLPTWLLKATALFNKRAKSILPLVGIYRNASNEKARNVLGWTPGNNEAAVLATAESLISFGHIKP